MSQRITARVCRAKTAEICWRPALRTQRRRASSCAAPRYLHPLRSTQSSHAVPPPMQPYKANCFTFCCAAGWVTIARNNPSNAKGALTFPSAVGLQAPAWLTAVLSKKSIPLSVSAVRQPSSGTYSTYCATHTCCTTLCEIVSSCVRAGSTGSEVVYAHSIGVDAATCIDTNDTINNKSAVFSSLHGSG